MTPHSEDAGIETIVLCAYMEEGEVVGVRIYLPVRGYVSPYGLVKFSNVRSSTGTRGVLSRHPVSRVASQPAIR
jgi:hypothetical protein